MADVDDILNAMSAKVYQAAPAPAAPASPRKEKTRAVPAVKRKLDEAAAHADCTDSIWNAAIAPIVPRSVLEECARRAALRPVTPSAEIARQQLVRHLCNHVARMSDALGIAKLPNSIFEGWQYTSRVTAERSVAATNEFAEVFDELVKAGVSRSMAKKKCAALAKEAERLVRRLAQQPASAAGKRVKVAEDAGLHTLSYGHCSVRVRSQHFAKLQRLFERQRQQPLATSQDEQDFARAVFCLMLRYDSLDGGGFQAALNEECFDVLLRHFDCRMECFASPLNCRYAHYCSAFLDTDVAFGSVGSFFEFAPRAGCFEANPPFLPSLIKRMAEHMTALLQASDEPLMFVITIPAWKETEGWQLLQTSRFNQHHMLLRQKDHGYCEGKQQLRKTRWRVASFDTSVFFWQNTCASQQWKVTPLVLEELRQAFRSKQAEERDQLGLRSGGKRVRTIDGAS